MFYILLRTKRLPTYYLIATLLLLTASACTDVIIIQPTPVNSTELNHRCDAIVPAWLQLLQVGETRPDDFQEWLLANGLVDVTDDLTQFHDGVDQPLEEDIHTLKKGEHGVSWQTLPLGTTNLWFDTENRLKQAHIHWQGTEPTLETALECLGPPEHYQIGPAHGEKLNMLRLDLYYPDKGVEVFSDWWSKEDSISYELPLSEMRIQSAPALEAKLKNRVTSSGWPSDLESIIID